MSTNHTPNYNLSQWEAEDKVLRADFNADNVKLDAALAEQAAALAAAQTGLAGKGNCSVEAFTYAGKELQGIANPSAVTINFRKRPTAFFIAGRMGLMIGAGITSSGYSQSFDTYGTSQFRTIPLSWSGGRLSFTITDSNHFETFNVLNSTYLVIAFYSEG